MSTIVGVAAEGPIDQVLLEPLIRAVARERAGVTWPVQPADVYERLHMRPRGHGGVYLAVKRLVRVLHGHPDFPYAFVIIVLDRRTRRIQQKIRKLIAGKDRFVLAIAKEEIEAWWLGDRVNTLSWLGFREPPKDTRYAAPGYLAEKDREPKKTLNQLTELSPRLDRMYGEGNLDLARDFSNHWEGKVRLSGIESQCPERFPPFCADTAQAFRRRPQRAGRHVQWTLNLD